MPGSRVPFAEAAPASEELKTSAASALAQRAGTRARNN